MSAIRKAVEAYADAPAGIPVSRPSLPRAEALLPYLRRIDDARWYSNFGPLLLEFETRLAQGLDPSSTVATAASATQALTLALMALNVAPGSLCAMPAFTFVATAHAAVAAGLTPWFLDVDEESWMLEPDAMRRALGSAPAPVGAVIPVSAFGRPVDVDGWASFRGDTGVPVVVDAAAAFDSVRRAPVPVVVSLHATKALGVGEGGFVACEDAGFIERFRSLTTFGFQGGRVAWRPATNAKLSEYGCAVGLAALDRWPTTRLRLRSVAQALRMASLSASYVSYQPGWGTDWVSSTCVVRLEACDPSAIRRGLDEASIEWRSWWAEGCHRSPAFSNAPRTPLPVTERVVETTIGLPFYLDMDLEAASRVGGVLAAVGG